MMFLLNIWAPNPPMVTDDVVRLKTVLMSQVNQSRDRS